MPRRHAPRAASVAATNRPFADVLSDPSSRARVGTFLTFALGGVLCGVWMARMPALAGKLGIGPGQVGMVVLTWGLAAIVAMQALRGIIARAGSRRVLRIAAPLAAGTAAVLAVAPTYVLLLVAVAAFGMAFGVMDVAMNAQASVVERAYGRPLMSGMHAGWCAGAMSGGLLGVLTAAVRLSFTPAVLIAAIVVLPAALAVGRTYMADPAVTFAGGEGAPAAARGRLPLVVYLLGALTFLAFMTEGAIADWSGLLLRNELRASEEVAALGYPLFELAMLFGRLVGDRLRSRLGTRRLLVCAGIGTAAALTIVVTATSTPMALAGFLLTGAMVCTIVPIIISLAGTAAPGQSAASVAQVGAIGYGGLLLGPVVIGFVAEASSIHAALYIVIVLPLLITAATRYLPLAADTDVAADRQRAGTPPRTETKTELDTKTEPDTKIGIEVRTGAEVGTERVTA